MDRSDYYEQMRALAAEVRLRYAIRTDSLGLREILAIYRDQGIRLDRWKPKLRKVRAAYFVVENESSVLLNAAIVPAPPKIFALAHELKHHLVDREAAQLRPLGARPTSRARIQSRLVPRYLPPNSSSPRKISGLG